MNRIAVAFLALAGCLTPGDGLESCGPTLECLGGATLESCANGAGDCWYQIGAERYECSAGCNCDSAAQDATLACQATS
jgi:hypothetical protein